MDFANSHEDEQDRGGMCFLLLQALQRDFCVVEIALSEGDDSQESSIH